MNFLSLQQIAIMKQAGTLSPEAPQLTPTRTSNSNENKVFGFEKRFASSAFDNHLKTPVEMDAEFLMEMSTARFMTWHYSDHYKDKSIMVYTDGNTNTYNPDLTPSGFMEENY